MFDSFKAHFSERLSNPLFPAFCLSWLVVNYEVVVYLFDDLAGESKIESINDHLASGALAGWWASLLLPLGLALAYIIVYPWISRLILWHLQSRNKKTQELIIGIVEETPMPAAQIVEMKQAHAEKERQLEEDVDRLKSRAHTLNQMVEAEVTKAASQQLQMKSIQEKLEGAEITKAALLDDIDDLTQANKSLQDSLAKTRTALSEITAQAETLQELNASYRKDLSTIDDLVLESFGAAAKYARADDNNPLLINLSGDERNKIKLFYENAKLRNLTRKRS